MIPIIRLSNTYFPYNTIIFRDSLPITENRIKYILIDFDGTDKLFDMVLSKYALYENIVGDIFTFYDMFKDIYNEHSQYYKELLENYNKEYNYALGNKRRTIRHDTSIGEKGSTRNNSSSDTNDQFDLPNKVVQNPEGYLTSRNKDTFAEAGNYHEDNEHTYDSEVSVIYDNEFLDLKRKYLAQIRNVYSEFAEKFNECFIKVFN